ncbi:MAG: hypothetical protein Q9M25_08565 [Mariprofundaceae bacterium]|nr:hypothetical protein [Mariprofundaceae bacterium]
MRPMNKWMTASIAIAVILIGLASGKTQAGEPPTKADKANAMQHKEGFIAIKGIEDDYSVIFHIMRAPLGASYSRDEYHLMVSVEKGGQPLRGLRMSSTVRHPDDRIDEKADMPQLGDWYMARYNLDHEQGRHLISVHFEVNGEKYSARIYYPEYIGR